MNTFENFIAKLDKISIMNSSIILIKEPEHFIYNEKTENNFLTYAYFTKIYIDSYIDITYYEVIVEERGKDNKIIPRTIFHSHDELKEIYEDNN